MNVKRGNYAFGKQLFCLVMVIATLIAPALEAFAPLTSAYAYSTLNGTYTLITSLKGDMVLDVDGNRSDDKTNIRIWESNGTTAQRFAITHVGNGWHKIICVSSSKAVDVSGGERASGTNVWLYHYNGTDAQMWKFTPTNDGYYTIQNKLGCYLDVSGGNTGAGTNVWVYNGNNSAAQRWALAPVAKMDSFIKDSRWKNGVSWGSSQTPKIRPGYSSKGCCAYAADFAKYVYGSSSPRSSFKYTNASQIKAGDVIYGTPQHWMCILSRSGNTLEIAQGNYSSKVRIATYTLVGNQIKNPNGTVFKTFSYGYHYY